VANTVIQDLLNDVMKNFKGENTMDKAEFIFEKIAVSGKLFGKALKSRVKDVRKAYKTDYSKGSKLHEKTLNQTQGRTIRKGLKKIHKKSGGKGKNYYGSKTERAMTEVHSRVLTTPKMKYFSPTKSQNMYNKSMSKKAAVSTKFRNMSKLAVLGLAAKAFAKVTRRVSALKNLKKPAVRARVYKHIKTKNPLSSTAKFKSMKKIQRLGDAPKFDI
jgi:hypothetical protein